QGILQGTYETFVAAGRTHFGAPDLSGRLILTGGLGGMGGAQPLAASMAGAVSLSVEVDPTRITRRLQTGYLDEVADSLDDAIARVERYRSERVARSVALLGNCAEVLPALFDKGLRPDLVTDQTSAHDPQRGYIPVGMTVAQANALADADPVARTDAARASMAAHVAAIVAFRD